MIYISPPLAAKGLILVDRGDCDAYDWTLNDFTRDGNPHELDCSGIVPAGAKMIRFIVSTKNNAAEETGIIGKNGNTNWYNAFEFTTPGAGIQQRWQGDVFCDTDRKVRYSFTATTWGVINLTVLGWFML